MNAIKKSFLPIIHGDTEVIILGTMPGELSLKMNEYYAHPRNRFWKIISTIKDEPLPLNYEEKKLLLKKHRIGLWDVLSEANRIGSLDSAIKNGIPNDLNSFLKQYKNIKLIAFNGQSAEKLFYKHFANFSSITHVALPSTSPANAGIKYEEILNKWRIINR